MTTKRLLTEVLETSFDDIEQEFVRSASLAGGESRSHQYTGTKALMLAVLEDGIASFLSGKDRIRTEAEAWIAATTRSPFAFIVVCETLGLEPDAVRRALRRMRLGDREAAGQIIRRSRPNVRRSGRIVARKAAV